MRDQPDGSSGQTSVYRNQALGREELSQALASHRRWLEGSAPDGGQANLSRTNLRGANLSGLNLGGIELRGSVLDRAKCANAILFLAKLQGASLKLCNLSSADLQGTDFSEANLNDANLREAYAFNAIFRRAHLNNGDLRDANFTRSNFADAWLVSANLDGAVLEYASLQRADLRESSLVGARLQGANLRGAVLKGANFDPESTSAPQPSGLPRTDLTSADLRNADLSDARLQTVTGLLSGALAGANLSNAKVPPDIARFPTLEYVAEISRHARTLFLAMIAACAYSWLTIATTSDATLVTNSSSSPLPIIQTPVPIADFFWAAPLILLGLFFYFHLYLQGMWDALAGLPAVFPTGRTLDAQTYPWLLTSLVRAHVPRLTKDRPTFSKLKVLFSILAGWWLVPLTLGLYWLRYLPRQDRYGTVFILLALVVAVAGAGLFYDRARTTLRGPDAPRYFGFRPRPIAFLTHWIAPAVLTLVSCCVLLGWVSKATSRSEVNWGIFRAYAELPGAELSRSPPNRSIVRADLEITRHLPPEEVERILLEGVTPAHLERASLVLANLRDASLTKADLQGARLRGADLRGADLRGADLRSADLRCADLCRADLRGADLKNAQLDRADLSYARLDSTRNLTLKQLSMAYPSGELSTPKESHATRPGFCIRSSAPCLDDWSPRP